MICDAIANGVSDRNGDKEWSAGTPATDAVFKIQKIVMEYNPGT